MKSTNLAQFAPTPSDGEWKRAYPVNGYTKCTLWYRYLWNRTYIQLRGVLDCSTSPNAVSHICCYIDEEVHPESSQYFVAATAGIGFCQVGLLSNGHVAVYAGQPGYALAPTAVYISGVVLPMLGNYKSAGGPRRLPIDDEEPVPEPFYEVEGESPEVNKGETRPTLNDVESRLTEVELKVDTFGSNLFAKADDPAQTITAKNLVADAWAFDSQTMVRLLDSGDGSRPTFIKALPGGGMVQESLAFKSDIQPAAVVARDTIGPALSTVDINDPALAEFKKAILDEVKKMLTGGGPVPPADIPWTDCLTGTGGTQNQVQARLLSGFVELRGIRTFTTTNSSFQILRLPPNFPFAETTANYVIAAREAGVSARYAYCYVSTTDRNIGITMAGSINEASFGGLRWKAAY